MQFFETLFLFITLAFLLIQVFDGKKYTKLCFWIGLAVLGLHAIIEVVRWQLIPCYFLFGVLSLLVLKRTKAHLALRLMGLTMGILLFGTSWFYASQLPLIDLPAPEGPYQVGTTSFTATDMSRPETFAVDPEARRELFVEVWYPATTTDGTEPIDPTSFWQELYSGKQDRVSFFMSYLKGVDTHSYPDLPLNTQQGPYPVLFYNHGLQMFTAQNTLLMEHLASHGYVIFSIAHPYESLRVNLSNAGTVLPDFIMGMDKFKEGMAWIEETSRPVVAAIDSIQDIEDRAHRAAIMLETVESIAPLNERVAEWVEDTRFVVDYVLAGEERYLDFYDMLDPTRIAVMGMSLGGATASEFCKADARCVAGINIDGLQYGKRQREPLTIPFLMMYSDDAPGVNDFLMLNSTHDYYEYWIPNTRHADFTDLTVAWPLLRQVGQLGTVPGDRMTQILNDAVLNFFDRYLKDDTIPPLTPEAYPEIEMEMKFHAPANG